MNRGAFALDTQRLRFAVVAMLIVGGLFAGVRYGTAYAEVSAVLPYDEVRADIEEQLEAIREARRAQSPEDIIIRKELETFESLLAARTIPSPSVDALAQAHKRLIAADLGEMKLYLYENGHATTVIPILSKGKRGSRWETPTGLYSIETRELNHFSSIGEVHMPYSMQFFGNFFIHGWPYYPDGTPVAEGFSGGCIRLSTEDAALVYEFARMGTPIFIWETPSTDASNISIDAAVKLPRVSATSFLVADIRTGEVYAERDATTPKPIASVTKLMTALVANETTHYDRLLAVSADDHRATEGTPGNIIRNDLVTVGDALYALLLESNNAVAYTLARHHGSENFMEWMNDKARAIGMTNTNFDDPSGISPENTASANDLFTMMKYIHNSQSYILGMSRQPQFTVRSESGSRYTLANFNHFAGNSQFVGGKVGYTNEARQTMTAIFDVKVGDETVTIAIIVLGSADRKADVQALLSWFTRSAEIDS